MKHLFTKFLVTLAIVSASPALAQISGGAAGAGAPGGIGAGAGTAASGVGGVAHPAGASSNLGSTAPTTGGNTVTPNTQLNGGLNNNALNNNGVNNGVSPTNSGIVLPQTPDMNGRVPGTTANPQ